MSYIKDRFKQKAEELNAEVREFLAEYGNESLGEIKVTQLYQGMRGMMGLVTETSLLDAEEGIRFRGYSIPELREKLPKAPGGSEPLPEGLLYLMLIGELPTEEDVNFLFSPFARRYNVPIFVFVVFDFLLLATRPMIKFVMQ